MGKRCLRATYARLAPLSDWFCFKVRQMANTKSAKKAVRVTERKTAINKNRRSRMRGFIRKVEEAISSGDKSVAETALRAAQPEIMRSAQKGVIHKNNASRKISRLSSRIRALAG
jgi:small subunit ribosomal protein S20